MAMAGARGKGATMLENYGIIGWIVIGGIAGGDRQVADARARSGRVHHHHPARRGRRARRRLARAQQLGWYTSGEGAGFIAAIVGAFVLLLVYRLIAGRRRG